MEFGSAGIERSVMGICEVGVVLHFAGLVCLDACAVAGARSIVRCGDIGWHVLRPSCAVLGIPVCA
jgi:hypothetical protein